MSKSSYFLVAVLVISAFSVAFLVPSATASTQTDRLGFWLQEGDIANCTWQGGYQQCGAAHPAQLFFNSMFLTPPYPSSIEVMIFSINQAKTNSEGCSTTSGYIGSAITFWGDLAQLADSNPSIKLIYEISFDSSNGGSGTYGLSCFNSMVQAFGKYPSVYGLGIEGEYTFPQTTALYASAQGYVSSVGKQFINYYERVPLPAGAYDIYHTNFPAAGDQVSTLKGGGPQSVGIDSGYYYSFTFPQDLITCPIGASVIVTGLVEGWNQCVVSTELSTAVAAPAGQRQFVELDPGFSSSGSFIGVSGQSTNQLWDNPTLRNWIWTDPNYQPYFVLGTSSAPPAPITTTTARSSSTTTTGATSSTTSAPPSPPPTTGPQMSVLPTSVSYDPLNTQTVSYRIVGGPPGLDYNVKIRTPAGLIQVIASGTDDANGAASGTMSYIFDVQNAIFDAKAGFNNGASSNVVDIQVGPPATSTSTTSTYVTPGTSSATTSASSTTTVVSTSSSQHTTTPVKTTSTTTSSQTTTSTTSDNGENGGDGNRGIGSIPVPTLLQSPTTTNASTGINRQYQGSGSSSTLGAATGFALGVTAGLALGLVVLSALGRGKVNSPLGSSGQRRAKEKEETEI